MAVGLLVLSLIGGTLRKLAGDKLKIVNGRGEPFAGCGISASEILFSSSLLCTSCLNYQAEVPEEDEGKGLWIS